MSTWDDEDFDAKGYTLIKNQLPSTTGPGNINLQLKSSLEGCKAATTPYVIKVRSDIFLTDPPRWLEFFSQNHIQHRLFVLGLSRYFIFSPRDQVWAGTREDMINLFDIPHMNTDFTQPTLESMYPELYLGLSYYARFSEQVRLFMQQPEQFIYQSAPQRHVAYEEWQRISLNYMWPVSRHLKYYWPKRFLNKDYNYDETAVTSGEFWHENIVGIP